ncbi:NUDIX hydrolase [Thioclava sp. JM3]|uniref:NUDIX hydrolase n=2 Tax=Paracoccaceae TaxID=31989 RepID=A0ABN4X212_9RHOB|nr:NUDIX hydrolase [Thioclava nitratireducens]OWY02324.1 NUDIX hydrolase [Thioclava sp. IC9]OWY02601.1 NUDIX hydrolase [Thioclava sp. F1Mire-8]OWY13038.1 NUDIX hydrolase [Thioclava sp. F34-6]OWY16457.1 NUDIX hydrolase [Thioclava sp. JM3]
MGDQSMKWAKSVAKGLLGYRPASLQVGALCLRIRDGKTQVLLITSRDTGRWVIPKGWPMRGRSLSGAAKQEAWEEAGVVGKIDKEPAGAFRYDKILDSGLATPTDVVVFPLRVETLMKSYPEEHQRKRKWFAPKEAAKLVAEEGLQKILRKL